MVVKMVVCLITVVHYILVRFGHWLTSCTLKIDLLTYCFYQRVSIASYANRWYSQRRNVRLSVCLSVRHTPVLNQNEES